jgi:Toprim domain
LERRAATCCAFEANSALTAASARIAKFHLGSLLDKLDAVGRTDAVAMPPGSASSTCKVRFMARGAAVRLPEPIEVLGIAEGAVLVRRACWAALNAALLATLIPPNEVQRIIIFGDNDQGFAGQAAAYSLARRIAGDRWTVAVRIPDQPGRHWNDVHARAGRPPAP